MFRSRTRQPDLNLSILALGLGMAIGAVATGAARRRRTRLARAAAEPTSGGRAGHVSRRHADRMAAIGGHGLPAPNMAEFGFTDPQIEISGDHATRTRRVLGWIDSDRTLAAPFQHTTL